MEELVLSGTHFDMGRVHGERFSARIQAAAQPLWEEFCSDAVIAAVSKTANHIEAHFPEMNQEIRGIAVGAGITFEEAFLYNNRSIISAIQTEDCSHVAVIKNGAVVAGMNKDSRGQSPDDFFVASIRPANGRASVGYRHIGRVWGYGVNDAGLCAAGTAAHPTATHYTVPSIGLYFVGPILLSRCGTVQEAVDLMMGLGPVGESGNVLVADVKDAAVVEFSPDKRVVRRPENGVIASTNFYASGQIEHARDEAYLNETRARYSNILRLASECEATVEGLRNVLSCHSDKGAVCRHDRSGDLTVLSFIVNPHERRFLIASGPPCRHEYVSYKAG